MTAIPLGVPEVPVRPIAERRVSRRIQVGPVACISDPAEYFINYRSVTRYAISEIY